MSAKRRKRRTPPARAEDPAPTSRLPLILVLAVLAAVAVAYWPSMEIPYLFDDHRAIERNPYLQQPQSFQWLYRVPVNSTLIGRPMLSSSFGLNALLFGHRPASYHAINLVIHLANLLLVAALTRRGLAYTRLEEPLRLAASLAVALLWGMHPLNVNAVAYLTQRGESLGVFFELLTLYAWLRSGEERRVAWTALACISTVLAVTTKEHGWIAPFLPLLWAWVFLGRTPLAEIRRLPVFYVTAVGSWMLLAAFTFAGGRTAHVGAEPGIGALSYFITQPEVLTHYLRLYFLPIGQSFDYDWEVATLGTAWPWVALWSALFAAAAFAVWKRHPAGFPAGLFFLVLATSSSFLALPDLAFEHRFYLAGAAVTTLLIGPLIWLVRREPRWLYAGVVCASLALGWLTYQRCTLFQSELAVWQEAIERNPNQRRALSNVGGLLLAEGRAREALEHFQRVEALGIPDRMQTRIHYQMGNALFDLHRNAEARLYYLRALESARGNRGRIYANLGHTYLRENSFADARRMFENALGSLTRDGRLQMDLSYACAQLGDLECMMRAYARGKALGAQPQPALKQLMSYLGSP